MATPQPQQPPQPIYQRDLNYALDRVHNRFVEYADARDGALASQMRVGFTDSFNRDEALTIEMRMGYEALLKRIESVETTQRTIIEIQRETVAAVQELRQETRQGFDDIRQEIRNGFTALDEKINELTARVVKLEGGLPPTKPEA